MEPIFSATLPIPPGINDSYKSFLNPKTGKSGFAGTAAAHAFKKAAARSLQAAFINLKVVEAIQMEFVKHKHIPIEMSICFYFEYMWKRDIDSGLKSAIDVAFKRLGLNDNLIVDLHVKKRMDKENPRVEIEINVATEQ